jgi:hypothetical protein
MTTTKRDYTGDSPDRLLKVLSKGRMIFWGFVALVLHFVMMLATSSGYIRDNYVDPEGAAQRKKDAELAMKLLQARSAMAITGAVSSVTGTLASATGKLSTVAERLAGTGTLASADGTNGKVLIDGKWFPAEYTNSTTYKATTAVATPEELRKVRPNDLGITTEETIIK